MKELSLNQSRLDNRYEISELLGRGSYAEIFLARDTLASPQSSHRTVVIKALNVFLQDDLDADLERTLVENFQNEAVALDRVHHPNIISRIGHGSARDLKNTVFHYLVLEYLPGGDLQNAVRKGQIPLRRAFSYIEQICSGLGFAHSRGVIHRDIKPQNLLLTADHETVKIADFGVARLTLSDTPITRVGTNIYAAPEHSPMHAGHTGELEKAVLTPAADVYSLAKSVYTIVTREAPRAFANHPITTLPALFRDEPWADDLLRVLNRATQSEPGRRHQTVDEFWNDLIAVRQMADDADLRTIVSPGHDVPQPHVSRGYTPTVPEQPNFDAVADHAFTAAPRSERMQPAIPAERPRNIGFPGTASDAAKPDNDLSRVKVPISNAVDPRKKKKLVRRIATFAIFFVIFTGILYGTHSYMRSIGLLSDIKNPFKIQTAVANTDVYLRSQPSTDNDPIGLVTKNSKVKIVNSQNNWYQVDIIEQGRSRPTQTNATRGWLNGKFLDVDQN